MIIRTVGNEVFVTAQTVHAKASGELAARLRPEFFDPDTRAEAIHATTHHDDGWREWEQNPDRHPDGTPRNFTELETPSHVAIWRRGVKEAVEQMHPAAAALIARHAARIIEGKGENKDFIGEALETSVHKAWPTLDPAEHTRRLETNYAVLATCDVLTLMVCASWPDHELELFNSGGTHKVAVPAHRDGDWDLRLEFWPFEDDDIEIGIPMIRVDAPANWDTVLADVAADRWNWTQPVRLRPA
ncbi:DUF3891 family protein [bacterium]|nr:DUF3891 family protein [bacterium]